MIRTPLIVLTGALLLSSLSSQVRETKEPLSATGCLNVVNKLQVLKIGRMKVKTCCRGTTLYAIVREENGKKRIQDWDVVNAGGEKLLADRGIFEASDRSLSTVIRTKDGNACFIVEKNSRR